MDRRVRFPVYIDWSRTWLSFPANNKSKSQIHIHTPMRWRPCDIPKPSNSIDQNWKIPMKHSKRKFGFYFPITPHPVWSVNHRIPLGEFSLSFYTAGLSFQLQFKEYCCFFSKLQALYVSTNQIGHSFKLEIVSTSLQLLLTFYSWLATTTSASGSNFIQPSFLLIHFCGIVIKKSSPKNYEELFKSLSRYTIIS